MDFKIKPPTETQEQIALAKWLDKTSALWAHVENESDRKGKKGGAIAKMKGVKAGFPDVIVLTSPPNCPEFKGVGFELKKLGEDEPTPKQKKWLKNLKKEGFKTGWARGHKAAIEFFEDLGYRGDDYE